MDLGNLVLIRRDSYLDYLKPGVKPDTLAALRASPLHMSTLFPEELLTKAEAEIASQESRSQPSYHWDRGHPYKEVQQSFRPKPKDIGERAAETGLEKVLKQVTIGRWELCLELL